MKKFLSKTLFIFVIVLSLILMNSCSDSYHEESHNTVTHEQQNKNDNMKQETNNCRMSGNRFVVVYGGLDTYHIVYDKETFVMYAVSWGVYNKGNFTLLVDSTGNPLIYNKK